MESGPTSALPTQPGTLDVFPKRRLEAGDITVLVLYFLFVMAVGIWVSQPRAGGAGTDQLEVAQYAARHSFKNVCQAVALVTSCHLHRPLRRSYGHCTPFYRYENRGPGNVSSLLCQ